MKKAKEQSQTANYEIKRAYQKRYECITTYHLNDKRLTLAEQGFLTKLYILPSAWKITQRATAKHFNISPTTFNAYISRLIELGYVEIKKTKNNRAVYQLNERAINGDFNPKEIEHYTIKQLNNYLNDDRTEERYKNLIKKALVSAEKTSEHFEKTLDEIDKETKEEEINDLLPF